jgi:hypothetical protein
VQRSGYAGSLPRREPMNFFLSGGIFLAMGVVFMFVGAIKKDADEQKMKAKGPFQTSVTISWTDRTGTGWTTGPLKWQDIPNLDGPTDDMFVVGELLKRAGSSIGPLPTNTQHK